MSNYNPYSNLAALAAINVLTDEDSHSYLYPVLAVCVHIGAAQAGMWMVAGKPCSKDQLLDLIMDEVEPRILDPLLPQDEVRQALPLERVRRLIEQGFDWLMKFEIEDAAACLTSGRRITEAI